MRASSYGGAGRFTTVDAPVPKPGRDEALLRVRRVWRVPHRRLLQLAASGAVPLAPLVTRTIPLDALQQGMEQALAGGPVMKILVDVMR